ncbi:LysR family transcriptional regulator [Halomonas salina]|uniref:LysR family transcriptional regulator n=1 Tax=Halomonas salina TaxID=42565 RepID=A0ABR4WRA3_9GAMM|nr:LysR family transcriptional regulator [Halomonas salina]KGE76945.1 LysR family transcriptional regulator [Halomonas salina]
MVALDTQLLQTFLEVSRLRNFGRAAESLSVSPSTVSARIRQLEAHMGLALFSRGHHRIGLTPAGERMERHARFLLDAWERAYEDTALSERHQRRLVVAGVASLWDIFLQAWLTDIYRAYPALGIRAEESTPLRVVEKLEQNMIDVGFLYDTPRLREVGVEEVATIPLVMVSSRPGQRAEQAVGDGYIRVEWGTAFASVHEGHFPQRLLARGRVNSGRIALNLLLTCGGAAYLPRDIVAPHCRQERLFPVEDAPPIELKAYVAYRLHGEHRELIRELLGKLK